MEMETIRSNFIRKGFDFQYFCGKEEAAKYLLKNISGKTVGIGGSMTLVELGLYEKLQQNNQVFRHWEQGSEGAHRASRAEIYLCSANGLSEKGDIVNIDGGGNRTASTMYGHDAVYLVCGINKLAPDFESALYRARNIACPLNARRLKVNTPCAKGDTLKCYDCSSPERICAAVAWLMKKPNSIRKMEIILIGEKLGF